MVGVVNKEDLEGYRKPTEKELQRITDYMFKELGSEYKLYRFLFVLSAICVVLFSVGVLLRVTQEMVREAVVLGGLTLVNLVILSFMLKSTKRTKDFLEKVNTGDMLVLDCMAYKTDTVSNTVNKGMVYIQTLQGIQCREKFLVDISTKSQCDVDNSTGLLLVKLCDNSNIRYEVFKGV